MKEACILRWFLTLLKKERAESGIDERRKKDSYELISKKLKTEL